MSLFKKAAHFASGVILAQLVTAASIPLLSRLYTPEDFSLFGLYFSIASILTALVTLRLETLLPKEEDIEKKLPVTISVAWITVIPLLVVSFLILCFVNNEVGVSSFIYALLIVVASISFSFFNTINILNVRKNQISLTNKARINRSFISAILQIFLSLISKSGLFIGEVVGRLAGLFFLSKRNYYKVRILDAFKLIKLKVHYIKFVLTSNIINTIGSNIYPILVLKFYDPLLVGKYFFVHKILSTPVTVVAQSISISILGDFNTIIKQNKDGLINKLNKMTFIIFVLSLLLFILIGFFLKYTEIFLFGEGWKDIYKYVFILTPFLVCQITFSPCSQLLILVNGERKQLIWDVGRLFVVIFSVLFPFLMKSYDHFVFSLWLYSILSAILYIIHYIILIRSIRRFEYV